MSSKTPLKPKYSQIGKVNLRAKAQDTHVAGSSVLITPKKVKSAFTRDEKNLTETVLKGRRSK